MKQMPLTQQRLVMTGALRQALEILRMPEQELALWLLKEIEKNPFLELNTPKMKRRFEGDFPAPLTLHEHLMNQIRDQFQGELEQKEALSLLDQLDERGFIGMEVAQTPTLTLLQTFEPPGIFARNLQESLLLQLKARGALHSTAYFLVENHYEDLLHGRFSIIAKKLKEEDLKKGLDLLARLSMRPAYAFKEEQLRPIIPDLTIERIDGGWTIALNEEDLPEVKLQTRYFDLDVKGDEENEWIRAFKTEAKWIIRSLTRRRKLLLEIGKAILTKQAPFLDQKGPLAPLSMSELASELEIHESTLSRAFSEKYIATPRGILPMSSLVKADPKPAHAREMLEKLIASEDKQNPLTDEELSNALIKEGIFIARRTVAKYRGKLNIGSASQRKYSRN